MASWELMRGGASIDAAWFRALADLLLNGAALVVRGADHRILELELYYRGPGHDDPFTHCDPLQASCGRWYLHRSGGAYRGGSFKGLDLTFGPEGAYGGILIRTLQAPDGARINGPSLCVDHLLAAADAPDVAALDAALGARAIWAPGGPIQLQRRAGLDRREVLATARVGLSLKRAERHPQMPRFVLAPYRFLTDLTIRKGKAHAVIALHQRGLEPAAIQAQTRSPAATIQRYIEAYAAGLEAGDLAPWVGRELTTSDLCGLHGAWRRAFGGPG